MIKRMLPHRYPMLLLDSVVELEPAERVVATKAVTGGELWYRGVGDDLPATGYAYPQTLLVESWCQCAALLAAAMSGSAGHGQIALFGGVFDVAFGGDVFPGDVLEHRAQLVRQFTDTWMFSGESGVGSSVVMTVGRALVAFRGADVLRGDLSVDPKSPII